MALLLCVWACQNIVLTLLFIVLKLVKLWLWQSYDHMFTATEEESIDYNKHLEWSAWTHPWWWTQGQGVVVLDHQTPSPGWPSRGLITPRLVSKWHTTPWIAPLDPQPPWGFLCCLTGGFGWFSSPVTPDAKETECPVQALPWKSPIANLDWFTAGPPTIQPAGPYQLKILFLLPLIGHLNPVFPGDC